MREVAHLIYEQNNLEVILCYSFQLAAARGGIGVLVLSASLWFSTSVRKKKKAKISYFW